MESLVEQNTCMMAPFVGSVVVAIIIVVVGVVAGTVAVRLGDVLASVTVGDMVVGAVVTRMTLQSPTCLMEMAGFTHRAWLYSQLKSNNNIIVVLLVHISGILFALYM